MTVTDDDTGSATASTSLTVKNVAPVLVATDLTVTPMIDENGVATLNGSFTDVGTLDTHTVQVVWGDGTSSAAVVDAATRTFTASHQYLDDDPTGTPQDIYTIDVTVTDDDTGSATASTSLTVKNVAPTLVLDPVLAIDEDGTATLTGTITDPGTLDTFTLDVIWGDPLSPDNVEQYTYGASAAGSQTFTLTHQYLDDNPTATPSDTYTISATVTDDDTGSGSDTTTVTVNNIAPVLVLDLVDPIFENGIATLTGTISDPGTLDTFTLDVNWGDSLSPDNVEQYTFGPSAIGTQNFTLTHQYLDDNPSGTAFDTYTISATVTDDDTGADSNTETVVVTNVAPEITDFASSAPDVGDARPGDLITVSGSFIDRGTLDTHTATVDWDDGTTTDAVINFANGVGTLSASHSYASGGIFTISIDLSDDDLGTDAEGTTALVTGFRIHDRVLEIVGTRGNDFVDLKKDEFETNFIPGSDDEIDFDPAAVDSVVILLGEGRDRVETSSKVTVPVHIDGGPGNDRLEGGSGNDTLIGGEGNDELDGKKGNDTLDGGRGADELDGGRGADILLVRGAEAEFDKLDGDDDFDRVVNTSPGDAVVLNRFSRGWEIEEFDGAGGPILGNDGDNYLDFRNTVLINVPFIDGLGGNDTIKGSQGSDELRGGSGHDRLYGEGGNDTLRGDDGNDILKGGSGDDMLFGGPGNDYLNGGSGNDVLDGGPGDDFLWGGSGDDILIDTNNLLAAAAPQGISDTARLTEAQLTTIADEATRRLSGSITLTSDERAALAGVSIDVIDLPGLEIGRTNGSSILIDADAAGHGWFIDATPRDDAEFRRAVDGGLAAKPGSDADGRIDLLTAIAHELGHVIDRDHDSALPFMASELESGVRLAPAVKAIKAAPKVFDDSRDAFMSLEEAELMRRTGIGDRVGINGRNDVDEPLLFGLDSKRDREDTVAQDSAQTLGAESQSTPTVAGDQKGSESNESRNGLSSQIISWTSKFTSFLSSGLRS